MADNKEEKEIDLLELARKLWDNRKFIIKVTLIGAVIGLIIAFSIPKEYTATVVFTTNSGSSSSTNMGALASLAGINLNTQSSEVFSPELYTNIMSSTPFIKGLLDINIKDDFLKIDTTLYTYLKDKQKVVWWSYVFRVPQLLSQAFKSPDNDNISDIQENRFFISREEMAVIEALKGLYNIEIDQKTGVTALKVNSQSPVVSAFLADTLTSYLQTYIIKERTRKAKNDLDNTIQLYEQSQKVYDNAQQKYAAFVDANQNIASIKYRIKQDKLESEKNLAYSLYTQMAQQLQMASLKVQDDTPVFTIIQPAFEPLYPSSPKKKMIFSIFILLSFAGACAWLVGSEYIKQLTKNKV